MTLIIENVMTKVVMVNQMIYHDVSSTLVGNVKTILVSGGKNWKVRCFLSLDPRDADGRADDDDK